MRKLEKIIHIIKNPRYGLKVLKRKIAFNRPWNTIYLEPTGHCNLRCTICPRHTTGEKLDSMSMNTYLRIAEQLFSRTKNINLVGLGEPLLHKNIIEMVAVGKKYNSSVSISTNGMLIDEKKAKGLILAGLDLLCISLDGATKETYEQIRIGADFKKVIDNIKLINNLKKLLGKNNPIITLNPVLTKTNIKELPAFIELAKSLNIQFIWTANIFCWTREQDNKFPLYYGDTSLFAEYINKAKARSRRLGIILELPNFNPREFAACTYSTNKNFAITWDGTVRPCCFLFHSYTSAYRGIEKRLPPVIFGNINDEDFKNIWNNPEYKMFRKAVAGRDYPDVCQTCLFNKNL